jgi:hypothetical protein
VAEKQFSRSGWKRKNGKVCGRELYSAACNCMFQPLEGLKQVMNRQVEMKIYVHKARKFHPNSETLNILLKEQRK